MKLLHIVNKMFTDTFIHPTSFLDHWKCLNSWFKVGQRCHELASFLGNKFNFTHPFWSQYKSNTKSHFNPTFGPSKGVHRAVYTSWHLVAVYKVVVPLAAILRYNLHMGFPFQSHTYYIQSNPPVPNIVYTILMACVLCNQHLLKGMNSTSEQFVSLWNLWQLSITQRSPGRD